MFIVITQAGKTENEADRIMDLFAHGLPLLHLRKPEWREDELRTLLAEIDPKYHPSIALHQHHQLANHFGIRRLHFAGAERLKKDESYFRQLNKDGFVLSTSTHALPEFEKLSTSFDYAFISPVFDSISKAEYQGLDLKAEQIPPERPCKLIALGGISALNAEKALALGFDGLAVLGAVWQSDDPIKELQTLLKSCLTSVRSY